MKKKLRGLKRKAIELDFDLYRKEIPIRGISGSNLSVIDIHPEAVEQTIIFVHGYAGVAESWEYQINHFYSRYRVIIPDMRGHGQSDAPYTQYTMSELVEDIQTIVEELNVPEKFILIGHSFGGSICVEYANAYRERLEKLVLIATAGEFPLPRIANWAYRIPTAFYRLFWDYRPKFNAEIHVMKRLMGNNLSKWQGWHLLRNITTPTLVIMGERDNYFPKRVFDEAAKMIPDAEIYDVGSAKHKVQLERHTAVNRAIDRFITNSKSSWRDQQTQDDLLAHRPWLAHYAKGTPHTVPIPRLPLHRFLESVADWMPNRTATIFYDNKLTYQQLNARANQFAHALRGLGVHKNDRVMLSLPNSPQFIIAYYAILKIGGVVVLPNADAKAEDIIRQINETDSKIFITLRSFAELAQQIKKLTSVTQIIFANVRGVIEDSQYRKFLSEDEKQSKELSWELGYSMNILIREADETKPNVSVGYKDLAAIIFTSGTTDKPKGVMLTHANLVANTMQVRHWVAELEYGKETCLSVLPLIHSYGMTNAMNVPISIGATIVLISVFELTHVLENIKKYKPTIFPGVPSMYTAINQAPNVRSYGLSSIKACISGAAPLPVEIQEAYEKLTRGRLVEGYGLTECSPVSHSNPLYGLRKVGSIGVPIPNTDAKIVDIVTGEDLPIGQIGELVIKGPQVMQGYWGYENDDNNPESALKDGWLYTGDVAVMDAEGYFQIISRKRDTIFTGDYSVYPRDVEEVLYENNKVLEAAVVGVQKSENGDQHVKAFIVPRPGTKLSKEELLDLCRKRLNEYAIPWEIEFRETLPKSFIGKVLRRLLVED